MHEIRSIVCNKLDLRGVTEFRLFNTEGVEIYEDDLEYIRNNSILYASRGKFRYIYIKENFIIR